MATPNVGILTTTGKALIDKVNSGQAKISFSKVVFSSMDNSQLSDTQIKALTAIAPQEVVVSSPQTTLDTNSGETRIRATGTNEKLADGVYVKTYGVFAKDDTGNEILYGVTVSPTPNYFPAYDGVTPQAVTYSYKTIIQETSNITMTNSNDVYVSQEDLTEAIAKIPQPDLSGYDKTDDVDKKLQNKQDKLGFTAADDSTVVHTADMRKPANDVAGIEEVNTKQDKIGYIPADDSKVVHDNKNGTEQLNGVQVQPFNKLSDTIGGRNYLINTQNPSATNPAKFITLSEINTSGIATFSDGFTKLTSAVSSTAGETFYRFNAPISTLMPLPSGTYTLVVDLTSSDNVYVIPRGQYSTGQHYAIGGADIWNDLSAPSWALSSTEKQFSYTFTIPSNATGWYISLEMFADINGTRDNTGKSFQFRNASIQKGNLATDSSPAPEDKVNVSDMRKPANDVAGIEEVNTKQDKIGYTPADDSKVAHLSGANNFDTVPTVNNNPLLLASSLPSDLARTSQQTNFTAGLQSGGINVATAADLKSVADKAWYKLDNKYITTASGYTLADPATNVLYKIDDSIHTLYLSGAIVLTDSNAYNVPVTVHLGSIIKSINTYLVTYLGYLRTNDHWDFASVTPIGTNLTFLPVRGIACITAPSGTAGQYDSVKYDELV
ncbi:hypothetical protein [Levilactobacillus brevis]|uniref:hypothetical protein n=1 Tax=Levilactobacillus brevis TaxID=1580 RepID=UPI0015DF51BC|nr:hypothetical protein [Levilactobacillus brevis]